MIVNCLHFRTWFYKDPQTMMYTPFSESFAAKIDSWYEEERRRLPAAGTMKISKEFRVITAEDEKQAQDESKDDQEYGKLYLFELIKEVGSTSASTGERSSSDTEVPVAVPVDDDSSVKPYGSASDLSQERGCDVSLLFGACGGSVSPKVNRKARSDSLVIDDNFTVTMQKL